MLIIIPVTIAFDTDSASVARSRIPQRVFALRYDTTDSDATAEYCRQYPPPKNAQWFPDKDGILLGFMPDSVDKAITRAAQADPESYAAEVRS